MQRKAVGSTTCGKEKERNGETSTRFDRSRWIVPTHKQVFSIRFSRDLAVDARDYVEI